LKKKWHVFDPKATGLIEAKDLRGFVLKIQLPFQ
jgi:hypothetical protein